MSNTETFILIWLTVISTATLFHVLDHEYKHWKNHRK